MKVNVKELVIGSLIAMTMLGVLLSVCLGLVLSPVLIICLHFTIKQAALLLLKLIICILIVCNVCGLVFIKLYIVNPKLWESINKAQSGNNIPFVKLLPNVYAYIENYRKFYKIVRDGLSDE